GKVSLRQPGQVTRMAIAMLLGIVEGTSVKVPFQIAPAAFVVRTVRAWLGDDADLRRLGALGSLRDVEFHRLSRGQTLEPALDLAVMKKNVGSAAIRRDETKP